MTSAKNASIVPTSISVILCVDRLTPFLDLAIDSILSQSDQDFEFLIAVNGGSPDLLAALEQRVMATTRIRLFRSNVRQLAFNLNLLADRAIGDYLVRMDADDIADPHRIRSLRSELIARPVDILGSWCRIINERGETIGNLQPPTSHEDIVRNFPIRNVLVHPSVAVRRKLLMELRGYLGGFNSEDAELWLRAVRYGARFGNMPEYLLQI